MAHTGHAADAIPVLVIAGATGTGKSALALRVAEALNGVIINADSRQVYADFPIITAQPHAADLARVPHLLYGFLPCDETLSAGMYAEMAGESIAAVHVQGHLPILVGGTGLYLQTLLDGIAPIPPVDPAVARHWRDTCAVLGPQPLHARLAERDPQSAARLHPNDSQRIVRALEVLDSTGKPLGHWHALPTPPSPYRALRVHIDMPLDLIAPRLAARIDAMIEAGAEAEARAAFDRCPQPTAPGWSGIGCAELLACITGHTSFETCRTTWIHNTRAYAKRQITWFKRDTTALHIPPNDHTTIITAWQRM